MLTIPSLEDEDRMEGSCNCRTDHFVRGQRLVGESLVVGGIYN